MHVPNRTFEFVQPDARPNPDEPKPTDTARAKSPSTAPGARIVNYFDSPTAAARYAANRPSGHARVLQILQATLESELPVGRALDVGCGTGQSAVALLPYADEIIGVDSSSEMLAQAPRLPRLRYQKAYAEALPFCREHFDLVTVASAYHWFDHDRFLREAARVLRPGKWLVLYKAGSTGYATDQPDFERWRNDVLNRRYPKVVRNNEPLTAAQAAQFGLTEITCERTTYQRRHSLEDYVANLMTHSSVIRMVDGGMEPPGKARDWLRAELAPFFTSDAATFTHEVRIHVLRRDPTP